MFWVVLSFLYHSEVWCPCQILCEPKTVHLLHLGFTGIDGDVCLFFLFSKINNQLRGFIDVEQQVVICAPCCKIVFSRYELSSLFCNRLAYDGGVGRTKGIVCRETQEAQGGLLTAFTYIAIAVHCLCTGCWDGSNTLNYPGTEPELMQLGQQPYTENQNNLDTFM